MPTRPQSAWNKIALLQMVDAARRVNSAPVTNVVIQKHLFLAELEGIKKGINAAYYRFFRFKYGPFSNELSWNIADLEKGGFIDSESGELLERGKYLLGYVLPVIEREPSVEVTLELIHKVSEIWKSYRGWSIVDAVYDLHVSVDGLQGQVMTVRDIPQKIDILIPENHPTKEAQILPNDLIEDISSELAISLERLVPSEERFHLALESLDAALVRS
jgi:hypothetical protein